jgi:hypothetical protein
MLQLALREALSIGYRFGGWRSGSFGELVGEWASDR